MRIRPGGGLLLHSPKRDHALHACRQWDNRSRPEPGSQTGSKHHCILGLCCRCASAPLYQREPVSSIDNPVPKRDPGLAMTLRHSLMRQRELCSCLSRRGRGNFFEAVCFSQMREVWGCLVPGRHRSSDPTSFRVLFGLLDSPERPCKKPAGQDRIRTGFRLPGECSMWLKSI